MPAVAKRKAKAKLAGARAGALLSTPETSSPDKKGKASERERRGKVLRHSPPRPDDQTPKPAPVLVLKNPDSLDALLGSKPAEFHSLTDEQVVNLSSEEQAYHLEQLKLDAHRVTDPGVILRLEFNYSNAIGKKRKLPADAERGSPKNENLTFDPDPTSAMILQAGERMDLLEHLMAQSWVKKGDFAKLIRLHDFLAESIE